MEFDAEIESLKSNPAVIRVYGNYLRLQKQGNKWVGLCPFHSEKSGSFTIFEKDMLFKCFGCGATGNCFQFVQKTDNCDFKTAVERVKNLSGQLEWEKTASKVERTFQQVAKPASAYKTFKLSEYEVYEKALAASQPAKDWLLKERGITYETAKKLHLGFRQNMGNFAGEKNQDIAGKGWITFPTIEDGVVTSIKYRSIVRKAFTKQAGMATALFGADQIDIFSPVYVTEGEIDALTLIQAGFCAVSLPSATTGLTPEMKDQIMRAECVILAGDTDDVGTAAMDKLWRDLSERTYLLKWPDGMKDANQTFLEHSKRDLSIFRTTVEDLTKKAKTQPMPDVYNLQEVMTSSSTGGLTDHPNRLRFPWPDVDKMAILLPGSVLAFYATQTGQGKTVATVQTTVFGARKYGEVVLNYQCELTPDEIATMVTAQILHKDRNCLTAEDRKQAAEELEGVRYYIGHNPGLTSPDQILDVIEAGIRRFGATMVVLDTFHNVTVSETNETAIQGMTANRIKNMAMKYKVKWINVGQPRKANQQNKGKRTHITDLRGSGAFADTSDAVFALHRDLVRANNENPADDIYEAKTLIQAQKTRAKGPGKAEAYLTFFGQFASFEQVTTQYDVPEDGTLGMSS